MCNVLRIFPVFYFLLLTIYIFSSLEAQKVAQVSEIQFNQKIMEKETQRKISEIEDLTHLAKMKASTDAIAYQAMKEAEANQLKLTPEYLELKRIEALAATTKVYYGPSIPQMVFDSFKSTKTTSEEEET